MKSLFSPFYDKSSSEDQWEFVGPGGKGLKSGKSKYWSWSDSTTRTSKTGPTKGHTHGYVFIESSASKVGDVYTMTSIEYFNAKESEIDVSYWYNSHTDTPVKLEVLGWNGYEWLLEDSIQNDEWDLKDEWSQRSFKIENYNNIDCKIRFRIQIPKGGKSYRKDFALDSISIGSTNTDIDQFIDFFEPQKIYKVKKFGNRFKGNKTKSEFDNVLTNFKEQVKTFDFTKYPKGVIIEETKNIVHVFTEKDK